MSDKLSLTIEEETVATKMAEANKTILDISRMLGCTPKIAEGYISRSKIADEGMFSGWGRPSTPRPHLSVVER